MNHQPNVAVKIIIKWQDRILIRRHKSGVFDFPGGRMEFGETILDTLKRELREELGYNLVREPRFLDVYNYISKNKKRHSVFLNYTLKLRERPELVDKEGAKNFWLTKQEFISRKIIKEREFLNKIFR
ncbi:NUDIX hydrolase [Candidatus Parcubacteria bacterium]|nr:NUDIX hydrolase [Patescibacteria group bacterium]MBU4467023.1 NUDIX hydrolase [Patescibacteria group bacterium]MCG2688678.1 NUDIX hydrolase [Candidatus Parcubacteria bacterium]